jgi:mRNA-capping enzyme
VKVLFSPDGKAVIVYKYQQHCVEVYKVEKVDGWFSNPTKGITYKCVHDEDIVGFGIACTGRFIMTCSNKTDLVIWDLRGNVLEKIDTFLINNLCAKVSPCGRFIAASGFASDVHVWEVKFCKIGEFESVKKVFTLTGHNSGVYDFAFDQDSSHMVTVCKDGRWRIFKIRVEYQKGEDPKLMMTGSYEMKAVAPLVAISPMCEIVAISCGRSVHFYSALTGNLEGKIEHIYSDGITSIRFDDMGKYLITTGDKYVRIFHNIPGYKFTKETAEQKLKQTKTSAMRDRIEAQINECNDFLKRFE